MYFFTARKQKGLGKIGVRHKVLIRHAEGHSRPVSVSLNFVFFLDIFVILTL